MRDLFAVPWLTACRRTLLSFVIAVSLVSGIFALLKISSGGNRAPAEEILTGSIQRLAPNDLIHPLLARALPQHPPRSMQTIAERGTVPLPRPRPNRL
jgi:hypothetical protein